MGEARWGRGVLILGRAVVYGTLFISLVLVFLPARLLSWSGVSSPASIRIAQVVGLVLAAGGGALALWCVLAFALLGRGTPAPFDPPRRLVVSGPYTVVRNPMYLSAAVALVGAALFYQSVVLVLYAGIFVLLTHAFVLWHEEPILRRKFGAEYDAYCRRVRRWWPRPGAGPNRHEP